MKRFAAMRTLHYDYPVTVGNDSRKVTFHCVVCTDTNSQALGLMGQTLPSHCGCLIAYESPRDIGLWMKDCLHPLCALFFDGDGVLVHKAYMSNDTPNVTHRCPVPAQYVLEVLPNEGLGFKVGDRCYAS